MDNSKIVESAFDKLELTEKMLFKKTWGEYTKEHKLADNPHVDVDGFRLTCMLFFINGVSARSNLLK